MGWISWIWEWAILDGKFNLVVFCAGISTFALMVKEIRSWFVNAEKARKKKLQSKKARIELSFEADGNCVFIKVKNVSETAVAHEVVWDNGERLPPTIAETLNPGEPAARRVSMRNTGPRTVKVRWINDDHSKGEISEVCCHVDKIPMVTHSPHS